MCINVYTKRGNKFILMLKNPEFYASNVFVRGILWIDRNPFKGHQLYHFLDFTCKIGGFNVYHKQNWTTVKHPELYTSHIFVTSILVMWLTGYLLLGIHASLWMDWSVITVTNLGWFGQFHTKSSVWLHGQLLLLKSLVRSLPATLYTFYTILNMLSEWFKPTRSGSIVLSGHGKWLCSDIPRQLGSRTSVAGRP